MIGRGLRDEWGPGALVTVVAGMVAYAAIVLSYVDYVPLWDGRIYADCILSAAERLSIAALACGGHNSHAYVIWLALAARLAPGGATGIVPILVANVLLGLLAIAALARLLDLVLPGREWALERALACCAFAVHPLFIVSTLQPNVDFGTLVFALPFMCALLERRVLAATLLGLFVVLTKETGVIVYTVLAVSVLIFVFARRTDTWREALTRLKPFTPLVVPAVLGGLFVVDDQLGLHLLVWGPGGGPVGLSADIVGTRLVDGIDLNYFAGIFVLNFLWVPTIVSAVDLGLASVARVRHRADSVFSAPAGPARAITFGAFALTLVLTRYKTFSNFRYFLTLYPLFLVVFAVALARRVKWQLVRLGAFAAVVVLFGSSDFRTIDPMSRAVFGTWPFGTHALLDMTANTGECCGHGRDQLVYNLEFTHVARLQGRALTAIRPTADTILVMDPQANWYTMGRVDRSTFRQTLRRSGTIEPRVLDTQDLRKMSSLPGEIVYFAYENVENEQSLAWLAGKYAITSVLDFDERGYRLRVYRMARRER